MPVEDHLERVNARRAYAILHNLAQERTGWRRWFRRWVYSDEPLRNDAANLLRQINYYRHKELDVHYVGDADVTEYR